MMGHVNTQLQYVYQVGKDEYAYRDSHQDFSSCICERQDGKSKVCVDRGVLGEGNECLQKATDAFRHGQTQACREDLQHPVS